MIATQRIYAMLGNESLWEVAAHCHELFQRSSIAHSICGGVAVCLHGYQRNTTDLDLIIKQSDAASVKQLLVAEGFQWEEQNKEFRSPSGIAVQFLIAGERAGKGSEVFIPEPVGDLNVEEKEGLSVVKLSRLIEMKIASPINPAGLPSGSFGTGPTKTTELRRSIPLGPKPKLPLGETAGFSCGRRCVERRIVQVPPD